MARTPMNLTAGKRIRKDLTLDPELLQWVEASYPDLSISQVVNLALRRIRDDKIALIPPAP